MMKDPEFRARMEQYSNSPEFQQAIGQAQVQMEELDQDPVKMRSLQRDVEAMMN
jgi:hypothetical protein